MTTRLLTLSAIFAFAFSGLLQAQNLLVNGGFETGAFAPWVNTGNVSVETLAIGSSFSCHFESDGNGTPEGKIEQTATTVPGTTYYVSLDAVPLGPASYQATITATATGGPVDGTRTFIFQQGVYDGYSLIFQASTNSTVISIEVLGRDPTVVDDVKLIALPVVKHPSKYTGSARSVLRNDTSEISNTTSVKLVAHLNATGQIVILEGAEKVSAGILLPDGTLDIRVSGNRYIVPVTVRGTRISFTIVAPLATVDEGHQPVDSNVTTTYSLTRVP